MGVEPLHRGFLRRFENHDAKSRDYGVKPPVLSEWWSRVLESYRNGFRCEYCGRQLKLEGSPDDPDLWTIDHRIPLKLGGDNSAGNIAVVCNRCNRAKSSLPADLYLKLLDAVRKVYGEDVLEQILYYLSIPGKAKKVETWSRAKHS
ncbi:MAG: HNH endonuclease signature motif containing protein [Desulfurococcaceae archaeon]